MSEPVPTLGIRRETGSRWERRVPLAPKDVRRLCNRGIRVIVQPSTHRVFTDEAYVKAGAEISEDLSPAGTIIGVKEVPRHLLIAEKTYLFFSHTIKAQAYNMKMLDTILEKRIRLIDYEKIVDANNNRLVRFGKWAGYAGLIDLLRAFGNRLLGLGYSTSFLQMGYSHMYPTLSAAKHAIEEVGKDILANGLPKDIAPLVFVFTGGKGACNSGSLEIFDLLPHEMVTIDELPDIVANSKERHLVYGCVVSSADYIVPNDASKTFDKSHYYAHPEEYHSNFHERIAPYMSVLVNNVFWREGMPRLLSKAHVRALEREGRFRLMAVADIACDIGGGLEFLAKSTTIDEPVFLYDVNTNDVHEDVEGEGILILGVDNLPTEFPKEASKYFGASLLPFLEDVVRSDMTRPFEEQKRDLPIQVQQAVITSHGELTPNFKYIAELRAQFEAKLNRILVLGAGMCVPALLNTLCEDSHNVITVASLFIEDAEKASKWNSNVTPDQLDIGENPAKLDSLVASHDLVISMMPAFLHVPVAEACIKHKRHLVTASYVSPAMKELHDKAVEAGVTILNEIGLDPGIDHISALDEINGVKAEGGRVFRYHSVCGGLPSPQSANNPLGYKFSWNPRGVLTAGTHDARYLEDGDIVEVKGINLFKKAKPIEIKPCFTLEVLPNRDSMKYAESYGLQTARHMFRGTLRYKGYSDIAHSFKLVGLMDETVQDYLQEDSPDITWDVVMSRMLSTDVEHLREKLVECVAGGEYLSRHGQRMMDVIAAYKWLGLLDATRVVKRKTIVDSFCALLENKLAYKPGEADMVVLQHTFGIAWKDGSEEERVATMLVFGGKHVSAMSKTVGIPVGVAAMQILAGNIARRGVLAPMTEDVYKPILSQLSDYGINFVVRRKRTMEMD
eukprot:TRINITY_DN6379_c0_g1_i1.p1 TRINITY_DN6379_c0_g1~~TRINITY_DN6379_c0_g1_i1.p1  ORF type:complete len:902 (-),score=345.38 TRINITY_DN6379_c0_g1_i1:572-3277(-)